MATGATIMSTTLPTVVGMGVVSKTTETMFGKRGRRIKGKSKPKGRTVKVHKGPRGGRYILKNGRKIYV